MPRQYGTTGAQQYASAPAVGVAGSLYYNTTSLTYWVSDGTSWVQLVPMTVSATAPSNPAVGAIWMDTSGT